MFNFAVFMPAIECASRNALILGSGCDLGLFNESATWSTTYWAGVAPAPVLSINFSRPFVVLNASWSSAFSESTYLELTFPGGDTRVRGAVHSLSLLFKVPFGEDVPWVCTHAYIYAGYAQVVPYSTAAFEPVVADRVTVTLRAWPPSTCSVLSSNYGGMQDARFAAWSSTSYGAISFSSWSWNYAVYDYVAEFFMDATGVSFHLSSSLMLYDAQDMALLDVGALSTDGSCNINFASGDVWTRAITISGLAFSGIPPYESTLHPLDALLPVGSSTISDAALAVDHDRGTSAVVHAGSGGRAVAALHSAAGARTVAGVTAMVTPQRRFSVLASSNFRTTFPGTLSNDGDFCGDGQATESGYLVVACEYARGAEYVYVIADAEYELFEVAAVIEGDFAKRHCSDSQRARSCFTVCNVALLHRTASNYTARD